MLVFCVTLRVSTLASALVLTVGYEGYDCKYEKGILSYWVGADKNTMFTSKYL